MTPNRHNNNVTTICNSLKILINKIAKLKKKPIKMNNIKRMMIMMIMIMMIIMDNKNRILQIVTKVVKKYMMAQIKVIHNI